MRLSAGAFSLSEGCKVPLVSTLFKFLHIIFTLLKVSKPAMDRQSYCTGTVVAVVPDELASHRSDGKKKRDELEIYSRDYE
jgi:hypothetical protein